MFSNFTVCVMLLQNLFEFVTNKDFSTYTYKWFHTILIFFYVTPYSALYFI